MRKSWHWGLLPSSGASHAEDARQRKASALWEGSLTRAVLRGRQAAKARKQGAVKEVETGADLLD